MPNPVLTIEHFGEVINSAIATPTVMSALSLRDIATHDPTTNAGGDVPGTNTFLADLRFHPNGRLIFVNNGLNQAVTVTLVASFDGVNIVAVGTGVSAAASTSAFIDNTAYAQLANAYPYVGVRLVPAVAPTTGTITVAFCAKSV